MSETDEIFLTEVDYEDSEFPLVWASISPHSGGSRYVRATLLADPDAVHLNMLRGTIAKPSLAQIAHIYGDEWTAAIAAAEARITALEAGLREAERFLAYFAGETGGSFSGPGTPQSCVAAIRALIPADGSDT